MRRARQFVFLTFIFATMPGFVCASRVEVLEARVDGLQVQFEEIQQTLNNEQAELTEMILRADEKLEQLEELQKRANEMLRNNSADLTVQLDQLQGEIADLRGQIEARSLRVARLEKEVAAILESVEFTGTGGAIVLPEDKEELYTLATERYAEANYAEARTAYEAFASRFPEDPRVPTAILRRGELLKREGRYLDAVKVLKEILERYQDSDEAAEAVFLMGGSFEALGELCKAREYYRFLKDNRLKRSEARARLEAVDATIAEKNISCR